MIDLTEAITLCRWVFLELERSDQKRNVTDAGFKECKADPLLRFLQEKEWLGVRRGKETKRTSKREKEEEEMGQQE